MTGHFFACCIFSRTCQGLRHPIDQSDRSGWPKKAPMALWAILRVVLRKRRVTDEVRPAKPHCFQAEPVDQNESHLIHFSPLRFELGRPGYGLRC